MTRPPLTQRQREVLQFISDSLADNGYAPTLREIAEHMGVQSTNGITDHLKNLERKGYLIREELKSRAMRPVDFPERPVAPETAGRIFDELLVEIDRFREHAGSPGMRHGCSPGEVLAALRSECDEVDAEEPFSLSAKAEAAGCLAVAAHLIIANGGDVSRELRREVQRLKFRLNVIEAGGTWDEAKAMERSRARSPWDDWDEEEIAHELSSWKDLCPDHDTVTPKRTPGGWKGKMRMGDDFDAPLPPAEEQRFFSHGDDLGDER